MDEMTVWSTFTSVGSALKRSQRRLRRRVATLHPVVISP